jgi:hypothetical protein
VQATDLLRARLRPARPLRCTKSAEGYAESRQEISVRPRSAPINALAGLRTRLLADGTLPETLEAHLAPALVTLAEAPERGRSRRRLQAGQRPIKRTVSPIRRKQDVRFGPVTD